MGKLGYIIRCMREMHYGTMIKRAKEVGKRFHKPALFIFADMAYSGFKYQAGYEDYVLFDFAGLSAKQRKTYVTRGISNMIVRKYNNRSNKVLFDKLLFHEAFKEFTKRSYLDVSKSTLDEFSAWAGGKENFIIKPVDEGCGIGVEKITVADYDSPETIYEYILSTQSILAEDTVIQDPSMAALYPGSINTLRIVTIYNAQNDKVEIPFTAVRIGNGGVIDNINNGGMASVIDRNTGVILYPAADKNHVQYEKHPITGTQILGFQIPMWREILDFACAAARKLPDIGYNGWDICLSDRGLCMIEGNDYPGHDIYQMPGMVENKTGLLPLFEEMTGMKFYSR